ncbi:LCP family protein [Streptomyces sp. ODS28]|uniref:LCP family protein n=1 Tax=Streptomyces sp. ODS28 TaxID=3136688 RepID=UPI0031EA463A
MNQGYGHDPYGHQPPPQPEILGYDEYGRPIYRQEPEHGYPGYRPQGTPQGQDPYGTSYDPYGSAPYDPDAADPYAGYAAQQQAPFQQVQQPQQTQQQDWIPQQQGYGGQYGYEQQPYAYDPQQAGYGEQQGPQETAYGQQQAYAPQQEQQHAQAPNAQAPNAQAPNAQAPNAQAPNVQAQHAQQAQQTREQPPFPGQRQGEGVPATGDGAQGAGQAGAQRDGQEEYRTEQFAFVEEPAEESEDVIDWLKFTESRTERREEAKRRGRNRVTALVVVLALAVAGGGGYLWYTGSLPGVDTKGGSTAPQGQQRDVIAVHLRPTGSKSSSTALLVDNASTGKGNTVLLPNTLAVSSEDGTATTLGKSVVSGGAAPTRESLGSLLGADIKGTWRLDTPFLENLVELVGGITVDTDAAVPGEKKGDPAQVERGKGQELDGKDAVAYATYRATGERADRQLQRFGQVMQATLRKISSDPKSATRTVQSLGQIPDPSLSESQLGASLAKLAERAKSGEYSTELLPVQANGKLVHGSGQNLVKQVLGGTVKDSGGGTPRVALTDATGSKGKENAASAALTNGGYTVVDGGSGSASGGSRVTYGTAAQKAKAAEVAKTLGLPGSAVRQGKPQANADVGVVLGRDYRG